ncbi:MAG: Fe-S cluster assembly protein SufD [Bacteroidetes bacterium]|nr:Fe-S cluster assembly protein SufD [Bacteroidota bacterium]
MSTNKQDKALQTFRTNFEEFERGLNGAGNSAMHKRRRAAMERLSERGFPTMQDEEWRYTNLGGLLETQFERPTAELLPDTTNIDPVSFLGMEETVRLTFIDGVFCAELSDRALTSDALRVQDFASVLENDPDLILSLAGGIDDGDEHPFSLLNDAFTEQGAVIHVAKNATDLPPVHLLFLTSGGGQPLLISPRILIKAEANSELDIIEQYAGLGDGRSLTNIVVEIDVADNAHVHHVKLQEENEGAWHISAGYARIARSASYANHYFGFGSRLVRNHLHTRMDGVGAECILNGLFMPMDSQHMDHHTVIDHAQPHCNSHELYKGLLFDDSRGVFSGKIIVRPDAQKTDAKQANNNLLLSGNALVDTKPQLEIWADDVKCTHGATIGRLDEDALFYLRSRGLPKAKANSILSYAFASELVGRVRLGALRAHLDAAIHNRLERTGNA